MFRFMRPSKTVLSISRLPLQVESQVNRGLAHRVKGVRFQNPGPRPRAIVITLLTIYVGWSVYSKLVLDPLGKAVMDAAAQLPEEEEEEVQPIFIAFPGTTKEIKPQPYRGNDPEVLQYHKLAKDQAETQRIQAGLAQVIVQLANKQPILAARYGPGFKLRGYWLQMGLPTYPPPEFERSGIEITEDYIAWVTVPVDSSTVFKIRHALWPSALAMSSWSFAKVMISDDAKKIARILGLEMSGDAQTTEQLVSSHQQIIKDSSTKDNAPKPKQPQLLGNAHTQKAMVSVPEHARVTGKPSVQEELDVNPAKKAADAVYAHFFRGVLAFKSKLQQTWRPATDYPPRGSIIVLGLVETESAKARALFDVRAAWDPKTKQWDGKSMRVVLKRLETKGGLAVS